MVAAAIMGCFHVQPRCNNGHGQLNGLQWPCVSRTLSTIKTEGMKESHSCAPFFEEHWEGSKFSNNEKAVKRSQRMKKYHMFDVIAHAILSFLCRSFSHGEVLKGVNTLEGFNSFEGAG